VEHAGEAAHRVGTAREAEKTDFVTFTVVLHKKTIRIFDVSTQTTAYRHIHRRSNTILESTLVVGADAGLVVGDLSAEGAWN
jgi:predicted transcriptional regulator